MTVTVVTDSLSSDSCCSSSSSSSHPENNEVIHHTILSQESSPKYSSDSHDRNHRLTLNLPETRLPTSPSNRANLHHEKHLGMHHPRDIMCLKFNQENSLFACSTDSGLRIYNVDPLMVKTCLGEFESRVK